jgi:FKBP-type peptidyl-prolyl isomerase-like protein
MKRLLVIGLLSMLVLQLSACGGSEDKGASTASAQADSTSQEAPAAGRVEKAHVGGWPGLERVAGRYANRLLIPHGLAPERVVIKDLKVGRGPVVRDGDVFSARYVTFGFETGKVAEPYWGAPQVYTAGLGTYKKGWEVGLRGMRVGGVRELIVPSQMAYKNGALVYVVQVLKLS